MNTINNKKKFNKIRRILDEAIKTSINNKDLHVKNPGKDYTRNRKLKLYDVIKFVIFSNCKSMYLNMIELFNFNENNIISKSAMTMQRNKIKVSLFVELFKNVTNSIYSHENTKNYKDLTILAVDGTDINVCRNKSEETYVQKNQYTNDGKQYCGYNQEHCNAIYDVLNNLYIDVLLQPKPQYDERKALLEMLNNDNSLIKNIDNPLFVCDRGYCSANMMLHFQELNKKFLFRIKNNISFVKDLEETELDITIDLEFLKNLKAKQYQNYKTVQIAPHTTWDFKTNNEILTVRILKFKLSSGEYETLVTNLFDKNFTIEDFKHIYNLRWGIETSFRDLKYVIGVLYTSSKKRENIQQEIYGKIILYNLCISLLSSIKPSKDNVKINNRQGISLCIDFFLKRRNISNTITLILQNTIPIRLNRVYQRKENKKKCFSSFMYRPVW